MMTQDDRTDAGRDFLYFHVNDFVISYVFELIPCRPSNRMHEHVLFVLMVYRLLIKIHSMDIVERILDSHLSDI